LRRLAKLFALIAIAATLCGFNSGNFAHDLSAYRGELVRDAVARLGRPIRRASLDGGRIYYWRTTAHLGADWGGRALVCKIWAAAQHGVIINWGYENCAY